MLDQTPLSHLVLPDSISRTAVLMLRLMLWVHKAPYFFFLPRHFLLFVKCYGLADIRCAADLDDCLLLSHHQVNCKFCCQHSFLLSGGCSNVFFPQGTENSTCVDQLNSYALKSIKPSRCLETFFENSLHHISHLCP